MIDDNLRLAVAARVSAASIDAPSAVIDGCAAYLHLLARWNRRINLTALPLEPPTDAAIDRLIVEPLQAARHVRSTDRRAIDIGSGGGSPALPLKIATPALSMTLVESRTRKVAFLREAARTLELADVRVVSARLGGDIGQIPELSAPFDLVTIRAVRFDAALQSLIHSLLREHGVVMWFASNSDAIELGAGRLTLVERLPLVSPHGELRLVAKTAN